jgi:hypothetical protein
LARLLGLRYFEDAPGGGGGVVGDLVFVTTGGANAGATAEFGWHLDALTDRIEARLIALITVKRRGAGAGACAWTACLPGGVATDLRGRTRLARGIGAGLSPRTNGPSASSLRRSAAWCSASP